MTDVSTLSAIHRPGTSTFCLPMLGSIKETLPPIEEVIETEDKISNAESIAEEIVDKENNETHEVKFVNVEVPKSRTSTASGIKAPQSPHDDSISRRSLSTAPPVSRRSLRGNNLNCASPVCGARELCYLCMQREMRNVQVDFSEERRRKEEEQAALLLQYQQMRDAEAVVKEKEKENELRVTNRKVAAYNLGVAEGVREEKIKKPTSFEASYILQKRALTPSRRYGQREYGRILETQVKMRNSQKIRELHDKKYQEKIEQAQLAEDLANQREQYLKTKAEQISCYQNALSTQITNKPLPIPKLEPDSDGPIFGKFDATNEKLFDQKIRAQNTLKCQLDMVNEKKKRVANIQLQKLKDETEMLKRSREELIADRISHHQRTLQWRKSLESSWKVHHDNKMKRLANERKADHASSILLLQQTDKYRRCYQCKKGIPNHGESNIWRETRYIPGSRIMV